MRKRALYKVKTIENVGFDASKEPLAGIRVLDPPFDWAKHEDTAAEAEPADMLSDTRLDEGRDVASAEAESHSYRRIIYSKPMGALLTAGIIVVNYADIRL